MTPEDIERFNAELLALFPVLRDALRREYGAQLDAWLERGQSKAVVLYETENRYISLLSDDDIREHTSELFYLDMKGYEAFAPLNLLTAEDCEQIRDQALAQIETLVRSRAPASGLKGLIQEIIAGKWDERPDDKSAGAFFVYAAILEDGQPEPLADLWILEHSPDRHDYIFLLESGAQFSQSWRTCADILRPEIRAALDLEYIGVDEDE